MRYLFKSAAWLLPLLFFLVGCASPYHCYPYGRVSCDYCPPKPLPYSIYQPCNCTDSIGQAYLAGLATTNYKDRQLAARPSYSPNSLEKQPISDRRIRDDNAKKEGENK
jgi:hypothetical protein